MLFKRKIYQEMLDWKKSSQGRTALLIEGALSVGKSTVVEEFAKKEYDSYILIDFGAAASNIRDLFLDLSDLNYLFLQLQLQSRVDLHERRSLIVFDEVQLFPPARQAIKYLVRDGRYDYIETGSLISIKKNVDGILIPSEEHRISMYPMDYEEFSWAVGDESSTKIMLELYSSGRPLGDAAMRRMLRQFRLYMLVGGMPQAVSAYLESNNLRIVDEKKREIIDLYENDFRKVDPSGRLSILFDSIPGELAKNSSRFHISSYLPQSRPGDKSVLESISELASSKTVLVAYNSNNPSVGLSATRDIDKFKLYLADTGLFVTLAFKDNTFTDNLIYQNLLSDKLPVNLGYVYENVVAQMLTAKGDSLVYHTFQDTSSNHYYEVDFLITRKNRICPIEVKSSGYKTHSSLDAFSKKYHERILNRYLVYTKDFRKDGDIFCIPPLFVPYI